MGNNQGQAQQTGNSNYSGYNDPEQPFEDLPSLFGPVNGYYYHINDKQAAIDNAKNNTNHEIPFIFKYTAIDYENIVKDDNKNQNDENQNDEKNIDNNNASNDNNDNESIKEYQQYRFEWVYIIANDNAPYRKITYSSYLNSLDDEYEKIRLYLAEHDPIPPHFLRKARMAGMVFQGALRSSLRSIKQLKCRIITKNVGGDMINVRHPALLVWNRKEEFGKYIDRAFYIIHLRKLPEEFQSEEEKKLNKEQIEIECRPILMHDLKKGGWEYDKYEEQDLNLEHGLVDIAHWCLKYEMEHKYEYHQYSNNCRQFMMDLCNAFKIKYDGKNWTDRVCYVAKESNKIYEASGC